jgi:natural product precursor
MKSTKRKKLALNKVSIANLDKIDLDKIRGGDTEKCPITKASTHPRTCTDD